MLPFIKSRIFRLIIITLMITTIAIIYSAAQTPVTLFDYPINTSEDNFSPSLTPDGNIMVYNTREAEHLSHDIYITRKTNGTWSRPEPIESINSEYNDETPFISADGKSIYFASDRPRRTVENTDYGIMRPRQTYSIYFSSFKDGSWSAPAPVQGDVNTQMNERAPSLSIDGKILFYTRYPFRFIRDSKIMKAELEDGRFVNPEELPSPVNEGRYDIALTPAVNGIGYYFSSIRKEGFGGWDIYYVEKIEGKWQNLKILPSPVNSSEHDLFLSETYDGVYFCSNRIRGHGGYDIYSAARTWDFAGKIKPSTKPDSPSTVKPEAVKTPPEITLPTMKPEKITSESPKAAPVIKPRRTEDPELPGTKVYISLVNAIDRTPVQSEINIKLKDTDDTSAPELQKITKQTESDGTALIYAGDKVEWLIVSHSHPAYKPVQSAFKIVHGITSEFTLLLHPKDLQRINVTATPEIKPVYFEFNSSKIELSYYPYLHSIVKNLRDNPSRKLLLTGHSDRRGTKKANLAISAERAESVKKYFLKMDIPEDRIITRPKGSIEAEKSKGPEKNQAYRRVDIYYID